MSKFIKVRPPPSRELGTPCADAASSSSRACCCIVPSAVRVVMDITDSLGLFPRAGAAWCVAHHGSPNLRRVFFITKNKKRACTITGVVRALPRSHSHPRPLPCTWPRTVGGLFVVTSVRLVSSV